MNNVYYKCDCPTKNKNKDKTTERELINGLSGKRTKAVVDRTHEQRTAERGSRNASGNAPHGQRAAERWSSDVSHRQRTEDAAKNKKRNDIIIIIIMNK
jgi:hypothetical protein